MGKLAERLADGSRSGVYRVETTEVLEEAVALNGFSLSRVSLEGIRTPPALREFAAAFPGGRDGCVMLFTHAESLLRSNREEFEKLLSTLRAATEQRRAAGMRCFAVFLDPAGILPLGPLYNRRRAAATPAGASEKFIVG